MNQAARRQQRQWTRLVHAHATKHGLRPDDLDTHATHHHYASGDPIGLVLAEAAECMAASGGDVHGCV
jgi:hypothetical protein